MLSPFLICLTLITGTLVQDNQAPKKTEAVATPAETVMVTGRVVYEDTGQPATRHRVQLILATALLNARRLRIPTAMTDERGEFTLRAVYAGEYYVFSEPIDLRRQSRLNLVLNRSGDDDADAANLDQFKKTNPSVSNVPDGSYRLSVEPRQDEPMTTTPRFVQIEQELTVNGTDVEDLLIEVSEGARLSGSVVLEGSGSQPQHISVNASAYHPHAHSSVGVDENGKFMLTGVPTGEIEVSAFTSPQNKFYVKSMEANGVDLLRNKITLAEKDEIKDVRIVISANIGVITGRVLTQTGDKAVAGAQVMLRRTGDDKLRLLGGELATQTDARGVFTLSAAPGNYLVVAWRSADGPTALEAAMNKAIKEQGTGLTLSPSARKEIDIRLP